MVSGCGGGIEVSQTLTTQRVDADAGRPASTAAPGSSVGATPSYNSSGSADGDVVPTPTGVLTPTTQADFLVEPTVQALQETPQEIPEDTKAASRDFLGSLTEEFHFVMAEEIDELIAVARSWNPQASLSIAVEMPDGSRHGFVPQESNFAASAVKPFWVAAALDTAGIDAVEPLGGSSLVGSNNFASGALIDLAGGVDAVNSWTTNTAGLRETRLEAWRFGDENRESSSFNPDNPLGNRTSTSDLAKFYARLFRGQLLDSSRTAVLQRWLRATARSLTGPKVLDGVLLDRLPQQVAAGSLHKGGWLTPGCCRGEYRQIVDAGVIVLPGGGWFSLAIVSARGDYFDQTIRWVSFAACRLYALIAEDAGVDCKRDGDGTHDSTIWPLTGDAAISGDLGDAVAQSLDTSTQSPSTSAAVAPVMYLTFDDGPNPIYTPQVLDVLEKYGAKATFFVLGSRAAAYPNLLQRIVAEGHTVGNHTWNHEALGELSREEFDETVSRTQIQLGGWATNCLRPPYASMNAFTRPWAAEHGLEVVTWDFSPQDWIPQSPQEVAQKVVSHARDGVNILMHDGGGDRSWTVLGLDIALAELSGRGYAFEPLCG